MKSLTNLKNLRTAHRSMRRHGTGRPNEFSWPKRRPRAIHRVSAPKSWVTCKTWRQLLSTFSGRPRRRGWTVCVEQEHKLLYENRRRSVSSGASPEYSGLDRLPETQNVRVAPSALRHQACWDLGQHQESKGKALLSVNLRGMVRSRAVEPPRRLSTCTSSMRVCQFRHNHELQNSLSKMARPPTSS